MLRGSIQRKGRWPGAPVRREIEDLERNINHGEGNDPMSRQIILGLVPPVADPRKIEGLAERGDEAVAV